VSKKVKRYSLRERKDKAKVENFARVPSGKENPSLFTESLPRILGGECSEKTSGVGRKGILSYCTACDTYSFMDSRNYREKEGKINGKRIRKG